MRRAVASYNRLQRRWPLTQLLMLILVFLYGATTLTGFSSRISIYSMLVLAALLGIAAAGQTLAVLIGGVDLSIAGWIVAGATTQVELVGVHHWPFVAALGLIVAIAIAFGGLTGYVAHRFAVHPLIVTLASGAIVGGAVVVWTKGIVTGTAPVFMQQLTSPAGTTFGIDFPPIVVLWAVIAIVIGIVLRYTVAGRRLYATGANPAAAEFALINTRRVWTGVFAASAVLSVCAGELLAGFSGAGETTIGQPYLFGSLTAVVVGGTAFGAIGDYWRTVLGSLILIALSTALIGHGLTSAEQQVVDGVLILVFVGLYSREPALKDRI